MTQRTNPELWCDKLNQIGDIRREVYARVDVYTKTITANAKAGRLVENPDIAFAEELLDLADQLVELSEEADLLFPRLV